MEAFSLLRFSCATEISVLGFSGLFFVAIAWTVFAVAVYRLTLHPLARFPGPVLARITDWYSVYYISKGNNHINLYRLHQKYGRIVRNGPNSLSFNDLKAVKEIYSSYGHVARLVKADYYTAVGHHFGELNLNSEADPDKHSRKRRIISQGLTEAAVRTMEPHFQKNAGILCDLVNTDPPSAWSEPLDVTKLGNMISFDVMTDGIFGRSFNMLTSTTNHWILTALPEAVKFLHLMGHMPSLLNLDRLPYKPQIAKDMDAFRKLSEEIAHQRAEKGQLPAHQPKDVFSYLLEAKDPETGVGMSEGELIAEAGLLVIAGSDATALAMTSTMYQLSRKTDLQERVRQEIASQFSSPQEICLGDKLSACKFLRACVDEALRLTPAIGGVLPRKVLEPGVVISGEYVPGGMTIGVPVYTVNRNEEAYPNPLAYNPDRWMKDNKQGKTTPELLRARRAFMSLSTGPRECVGKSFGYAEVTLVMAKVVATFELKLESLTSELEMTHVKDFQSHCEDIPTKDKGLSHPLDGPYIRFRRR